MKTSYQNHNEAFIDHLLGCQEGAAWDLPPLIIIRNQLIILQSENTVGFHDGILKLLVLLWWTRRYN